MHQLTELDIVNSMLTTLGELPLNELDDAHPLVPAARQLITDAWFTLLGYEWWFNTEYETLGFNPADGSVTCPADGQKIVPLAPWRHLVQRGRKLYDPTASTYAIGSEVRVRLSRLVPLTDLPLTAQRAVQAKAKLDFSQAYDGDQLRIQQMAQSFSEVFEQLNREHTRQGRVNLLEAPAHLTRKTWIRGSVRRNRPF